MSEDFKKILKHHAKSFYFAGLLLDKETLNNSAVLYAFCRQLDDAADLGLNNKEKVDVIVEDYRSVVSKNNVNIAFKELQKEFNLDQIFIDDLIDGVKADLDFKQPQTLKDLIIYSYKVAGTVGGLMAKILGAKDKNAWKFALDLGIGMQLTNISRDIKEDFLNKRIYIPKDMLNTVSNKDILDPVNKDAIFNITQEILNTANKYYESGMKGIAHIPNKNKFSILLAGHLYQSIGYKILNHKNIFLKNRSYLNILEKIIIFMKLYFRQSKYLGSIISDHETAKLHTPYFRF